jgi:hemolysin III
MAGVAYFVTDARLRHGYFVLQLFVIAVTACHYFAVL